MANWLQSRKQPVTVLHAVRTAAAALASLALARLLRIPEPHWAPISTLVVMQSDWGHSLPISVQRFAGTAVGAAFGAVVYLYFPGNLLAFSATVLVIGLLCALGRAERAAYRYAAITLAIVLLIPHHDSPWRLALYRFVAVSLGIAVGLACSFRWPAHPDQ